MTMMHGKVRVTRPLPHSLGEDVNKKIVSLLVAAGLVIAAVVLFVFGAVLGDRGQYAVDEVHRQLSEQKITIPPKTSPALKGAEYDGLRAYAQDKPVLVESGGQAQAYADHFIHVHLSEMGQTYSQASTDAMAARAAATAAQKAGSADAATLDAKATALEAKVQTLFRGQSLRGMLLNAWGWWLQGRYALTASIYLYVFGVLSLLGGALAVVIGTRKAKTA